MNVPMKALHDLLRAIDNRLCVAAGHSVETMETCHLIEAAGQVGGVCEGLIRVLESCDERKVLIGIDYVIEKLNREANNGS